MKSLLCSLCCLIIAQLQLIVTVCPLSQAHNRRVSRLGWADKITFPAGWTDHHHRHNLYSGLVVGRVRVDLSIRQTCILFNVQCTPSPPSPDIFKLNLNIFKFNKMQWNYLRELDSLRYNSGQRLNWTAFGTQEHSHDSVSVGKYK